MTSRGQENGEGEEDIAYLFTYPVIPFGTSLSRPSRIGRASSGAIIINLVVVLDGDDTTYPHF